MNGHDQRRNPHSPLAQLWTHDRDGNEAPAGYAFNLNGQIVPVAYMPWAQGPQMPWESFSNPEYVSLMQADSTIEAQPNPDPTAPPRYGRDPLGRAIPPVTHGDVALVRNELYRQQDDDDDEPTQDVGTTSQCFVGSKAIINRQNWRRPRALLSYVMVPSPDDDYSLGASTDPNNPPPLNIVPVQANIDDPPVGGVIAIAQLKWGHKGAQFTALYDVPGGQVVRIPLGASFVANDGLLAPKYYTPSGVAEPVTGFRPYLLFPKGPLLTTPIWNNLTQDILPKNGVADTTPCVFAGWIAEAQTFNTDLTRPVRRFYGSCLCTGTPPNPFAAPPTNAGQVTVCPIAWWSSQVTLVSSPGLNFAIRGQTTTSGTQFWGPFPANTPIQMPVGATSIIVFQVVSFAQPGVPRIETVFELDFSADYA